MLLTSWLPSCDLVFVAVVPDSCTASPPPARREHLTQDHLRHFGVATGQARRWILWHMHAIYLKQYNRNVDIFWVFLRF